ncbi:toprim domain-containing protein [Sandarakinorhabdus sp. AAP62]|uniref:DUF7146 domain-containing protein n=1 Tax=Sandarakinorhabdus sp. AAP62 TaxID=1248916 RepID=UPI0009D9538B|nr:toprim domain-containing protein [Sandarakinorhabdus sp. AAP62]
MSNNHSAAMAAVARVLLGEENSKLSSRTELRWGRKGSLAVDIQKGTWYDFEAGQGGGVIDLIRRERRCDVKAALQFFAGIGEQVEPLRDSCPQSAMRPDMKHCAMRIWQEGQAIRNTPGERYLRERGLSLSLPESDMRFHPRCPFGRDGDGRPLFLPAMICLMRSVLTGERLAIHRTAIDTLTFKKVGRKMLGPCEGAAVMIGGMPSGDGRLSICEGVETGLAITEAGGGPVWALGAAGKVARFPVVGGVRQLTTWVDYDEAGLAASAQCERRWQRAGIQVVRMCPSNPGWDFLDELNARNSGYAHVG